MSVLHTRRQTLALLPVAVLGAMLPGAVRGAESSQNLGNSAIATTIDHSLWAGILDGYLKPSPDGVNRFAYRKVSKSARKDLTAYLAAMSGVAAAKLAEREQRAFWTNLYNALTIDVVLEHYPVKSIRDISISPGLFSVGPWGKKVIEVEGRALSLDDIEHKILRKTWPDPRVHYSVNCASIGCPNLPAQPFTGAKLEKMLDDGARAYVNHPRGVSVDDKGRVKASRIFDWYAADFGGTDASRLAHFRQYAEAGLRDKLKAAGSIASYDYDWSLNEA